MRWMTEKSVLKNERMVSAAYVSEMSIAGKSDNL